ncbi:MAG: FkbM family methyltransferase [Sphingomicrobium sp.]
MDARPLIEALPRELTLTLVDVGSAGGLNMRWKPFASILSSVLFDPREKEASGNFGRGRTRTYPVALGDRDGEAPLYLTAMANMSSFLEPDPSVFERYGKKKGDASVTATEAVPTERLDGLAAREGFRPDVLKVDTQGSELMVLKGAEQALSSVMLAEIEVSFFRRYKEQPLFADIEAHMTARGFDLIDLLNLKRYRSSNSLGIRNAGVRAGDRSGRVAYADAIFLRRGTDILADGETLLKAVVALAAYGKADMAAQLLDQGHDLLPAGQIEAVGSGLKKLGAGLVHRLLGRA